VTYYEGEQKLKAAELRGLMEQFDVFDGALLFHAY
jgi:hypothetical protein